MRMAVIPTHVVLDGPCANLVDLDTASCLENLGVDLVQLGMLHRRPALIL